MKYILLAIMILYSSQHTYAGETFEGCYTRAEEITNLATGKISKTTSWVNISKHKDNYYRINGEIYGANFHVCSLIPEEGVDLKLHAINNSLYFKFTDKSYDMNCELTITKNNKLINIQDRNFNCSRLFSCGARVSVNDATLAHTPGGCT